MPSIFFLIFSLLSFLLFSAPVWAEYEVLEVALAHSIQDRQPFEPTTPAVFCEKDKNEQSAIPVVDSSVTEKIFFWTRIASTEDGSIRHAWHQQIDESWEPIAEVDLTIRPSSSYRMWSSKSLLPNLHIGEWMIVVSPSDQPEQILCITRFSIK